MTYQYFYIYCLCNKKNNNNKIMLIFFNNKQLLLDFSKMILNFFLNCHAII